MATPRTDSIFFSKQLPSIIGTPICFCLHSDETGTIHFFIGGNEGLHHLQLENGTNLKYVRLLNKFICLGVVLINCDGQDSPILACLFPIREDNPRKGEYAHSEIIFYKYYALESICERLSSLQIEPKPLTETIITLEKFSCDPSWGRARKMVYSPALNCIFLSTKFDPRSSTETKYQSSSVWKIPLTIHAGVPKPTGLNVRIIHTTPGNMRFMAISDDGKYLAVDDLVTNDLVEKRIDLYETDGKHLCQLFGPDPNSFPIGEHTRGMVLDAQNRLYLTGEDKAIRRLHFVPEVYKKMLFRPTGLVVKDNKLFIIGSKRVSKDEIKGYLASLVLD